MPLMHIPKPSALSCVAAPILCILAARALLPGVPATASAQPAPPTPAPAAKDAPKVRDSADDPDLVRAVRGALATPMGPCAVTAPAERVAPAATPSPEKARTPDFALTSIAGSGRLNIAMIDGRARRVGDEAAPGWRIAAIDPAAGTATLAGPDDRTVTLTLRKDR